MEQQANRISRNDLLELDMLARVALVYCVRKIVENDLNEYPIENDLMMESKIVLDSIMIDLATGKVEPTLSLANRIWRMVFDLSVGLEIYSKKSCAEQPHRLAIMHECAKFLYNTILAIQSQSLPSSVYIARSLDSIESMMKIIHCLDSHNKSGLIDRVEFIYQNIWQITKSEKAEPTTPIPREVIENQLNIPLPVPKRKMQLLIK